MIRIAVCDDIKEELSEITEHIEAFAGSRDLTDTIDVTAYDSSSALMDDAGYARGRDHGMGVKSMSSFARDNRRYSGFLTGQRPLHDTSSRIKRKKTAGFCNKTPAVNPLAPLPGIEPGTNP